MGKLFDCVNCKQNEGTEIRFGVLICPTCAQVVDHVRANLNVELEQLRTLAQEAIRLALVEGRLHLQEKGEELDVSKAELLKAIASMPTRQGDSP